MFYDIFSGDQQPLRTPPSLASLRIPARLPCTPEHFIDDVLRECLIHFTLEDVDSSVSQHADALARLRTNYAQTVIDLSKAVETCNTTAPSTSTSNLDKSIDDFQSGD